MLVKLFNEFGASDTYGQGFPSRQTYTEDKLQNLNGTPSFAKLIERVYDPLEFEGKEDCDHSAAVADINKFLRRGQLHLVISPNGIGLRPLLIANVAFAASTRPASSEFISEHVAKCEEKLKAGDYAGAITNARSLCEEVLFDIERQLDRTVSKHDGDLGKLFKRVRKLLNMDPDQFKERDDIMQLLRGLTTIVDALASISNELGDRHGGSGLKPKPH
jgi:Abortive infection C-terminus